MFFSKRRLWAYITGFLFLQLTLGLAYLGFTQFLGSSETSGSLRREKNFLISSGTNHALHKGSSNSFVSDEGIDQTSEFDVGFISTSITSNVDAFNSTRFPSSETTSFIKSTESSEYLTLLTNLENYIKDGKNYKINNNLPEWFPKTFNQSTKIKVKRNDYIMRSAFGQPSKNISNPCFIKGTHSRRLNLTFQPSPCRCRYGWSGAQCSIPDFVEFSTAESYLDDIKVRSKPRKIVNAIAFNMEFDLLEARIHELSDVVDLFLIYESNYTLYGDAKPLRLLERLMSGYLMEFHDQIYYLFLGYFPIEAHSNGWFAEEYERMFIGREGVKHVQGLFPDDLFIYTDADEIPSRDATMFLKIHDGYPEPFGFSLRWSVFGFFWKQYSLTDITSGCSMRMFRYLFANNAQNLRTSDIDAQTLSNYISTGQTMHRWNLGDKAVGHAGWHCSWCLKPDLIKIKLRSAVNADFPRWGDYPEKNDLDYIKSLIKTGTWFDNLTKFDSLVSNKTDRNFAPLFFLQNWDRFKYVLDINGAQ